MRFRAAESVRETKTMHAGRMQVVGNNISILSKGRQAIMRQMGEALLALELVVCFSKAEKALEKKIKIGKDIYIREAEAA